MKNVLITGAAGFIGRYSAKEFARSGHRTIGVDWYQATNSFCNKWRIHEYASIHLNPDTIDDLIGSSRPDIVVHCAGSASVPFSNLNPKEDFNSSVLLLMNVLDSIRRHQTNCKLVFLSSAAVYGNPVQLPIDEKHPLNPISPYGYHKMLCETLLKEFYLLYGVASCAARVFSAYGRGLKRQVIWDISQKALNDDRVELLGTGHESRDFINVADIAKALGILTEKAEFKAEAYNIASGEDITIKDLAVCIIKALNLKRDICFSGLSRAGDPLKWRADISCLRSLGFSQTISLEQGIREYANYIVDLNRVDNNDTAQNHDD
jgi:UDP-glucose 4-epimerase